MIGSEKYRLELQPISFAKACEFVKRYHRHHVPLKKNGLRYKQYILPEGVNLDLFVVLPPAQWGVIFALRTRLRQAGSDMA